MPPPTPTAAGTAAEAKVGLPNILLNNSLFLKADAIRCAGDVTSEDAAGAAATGAGGALIPGNCVGVLAPIAFILGIGCLTLTFSILGILAPDARFTFLLASTSFSWSNAPNSEGENPANKSAIPKPPT